MCKCKNLIDKLYEKMIWTHKYQACLYDDYYSKYKTLSLIRTIFYSISSSGIVVSVILDVKIATIISALVVFATLLFDNILKVSTYSEKIFKVKNDVAKLYSLKNHYELFLNNVDNNLYSKEEVIQEKYLKYMEDFEKIAGDLYPVTKLAEKMAHYKINVRKDEQIDSQLVSESLNKSKEDVK